MRYHGAKFRLAPWVISFFPDHYTYVEPFGGAAGVLLQKERSLSEVYNDLDEEIVNVFRVLQDKDQALELERKIRVTPYSREEFKTSFDLTKCPIESARRTLIRAHMGFGSAGATKGKTGFRIDSAREYGTPAHIWARYPNEIAAFVERFQSVIIENKPAIEVIDNHDRHNTLFFVDPPYLHATRKMHGNGYYRHVPFDIARCDGVGSNEEGWREGCDACLRRLSLGDEARQAYIEPPEIIVFECEYLITA